MGVEVRCLDHGKVATVQTVFQTSNFRETDWFCADCWTGRVYTGTKVYKSAKGWDGKTGDAIS